MFTVGESCPEPVTHVRSVGPKFPVDRALGFIPRSKVRCPNICENTFPGRREKVFWRANGHSDRIQLVLTDELLRRDIPGKTPDTQILDSLLGRVDKRNQWGDN